MANYLFFTFRHVFRILCFVFPFVSKVYHNKPIKNQNLPIIQNMYKIMFMLILCLLFSRFNNFGFQNDTYLMVELVRPNEPDPNQKDLTRII